MTLAGGRTARGLEWDRYWGPNENFVLVRCKSGGNLEADGGHQLVTGRL